MPHSTLANILFLLSFTAILIFFSCTPEKEPVEVYIMRHNEKEVWDNPDTTAVYDPALSPIGIERAE